MYPEKIDGPCVALGDCHGEYEKTKTMLSYLTKEKIIDDRHVIFIGDYVDNGPNSKDLISLLLAFKKYHINTHFCMGNHDLNLAKALNIIPSPHEKYYWDRIPERNREVLKSYGAKDGDDLINKMPLEHKEFLANLDWVVEHPNYLFVHSGIDPNEDLDYQLEELRKKDSSIFKPKWLYKDGLGYVGNNHQTDKIIVTGHININKPMSFDNRFVIDTGAGYGGKLTALLLPEKKCFQV